MALAAYNREAREGLDHARNPVRRNPNRRGISSPLSNRKGLGSLPLSKEDLEAKAVKMLLQRALLSLWQGIGFFGLTLIPIGLYYLCYLSFAYKNPRWCQPLEEFKFPSGDALRMIWAVGVIAGMLLFGGAVFAIVVMINIMSTCLNITNWFLDPGAWNTCSKALVGTLQAVTGVQ